MKIVCLGSLGNINKYTVPRLIADGHEVTVITSREEGKAPIETLGAKALVGSMQDAAFLTQAFAGQDTVYLMISGRPSAQSMLEMAKDQAQVFAQTLENSDVQNIVNLSSVGAQNPKAGALYMYHHIENSLTAVAEKLGANLAIIRPVGFYQNLFADLQNLKTTGKIFGLIQPDKVRQFADPSDIAEVAYQVLSETPQGKTIRYVVSDAFTTDEWLNTLAEQGISADYQVISKEVALENMLKVGMTPENAELFAQMSAMQNDADAYAEFEGAKVVQGKVKMEDFAKVFAAAYRAN
ncbi:MAG: NAD(P)H-binding protein [Streptococcaceae bacterium]|jgi:uncharacterized protein YbjT (DUF2867 family)|nr:NAD(P)H-binding protein [Streptococcaceae bacterium]